MKLAVAAERSSTITVKVGSVTLAKAKATGESQTMIFTLPDGRHRIAVTATDASGNESVEATTLVDADGTPPGAPSVEVRAGDAGAPDTTFVIRGEPNAGYRLKVAGQPEVDGSLSAGGTALVETLLPVGAYHAAVALRDRAGNVSASATHEFIVAIDPPAAPALRVTSKPGARTLTVALSGPAKGTAIVKALGEKSDEKTVPTAGTEVSVSLVLPDGTYRVVATVTDFQGRESPEASISSVVVDTTAPNLYVDPTGSIAGKGKLGMLVSADPASRITAKIGGRSSSWVASERTERKVIDLPAGSYVLTVVASDDFGNVSTYETEIVVALTAVELVTGLLFAAALAAVLWWQRRRFWRFARWTTRVASGAAAESLRRSRYRRFERAQCRAQKEFTVASAAFETQHRAWKQSSVELERRIALAGSFDGFREVESLWGLVLRQKERILFVLDNANLVETRRQNGYDMMTVVGRGRVFVTSERVLFVGPTGKKEWAFSKYVSHSHGAGITTIQVTNRQRHAGIGYAVSHADDVNFFLLLALADFASARARFSTDLRRQLALHIASEPVAPEAPEILSAMNPFRCLTPKSDEMSAADSAQSIDLAAKR